MAFQAATNGSAQKARWCADILVVIAVQGRGVMEAIVKSLNQSDLVEGGSFTNKRQPIRSAPRSASDRSLSMCLLKHRAITCHVMRMHMSHIVAVSKLMTRDIHDLQLGEALSTYQGEKWQ